MSLDQPSRPRSQQENIARYIAGQDCRRGGSLFVRDAERELVKVFAHERFDDLIPGRDMLLFLPEMEAQRVD